MNKEQIEAEGWKFIGRSVDIWFEREGNYDMGSWTSYKAVLQYGLHDHRLRIFLIDHPDEYDVFRGKCPDIDTFRIICKLVGIYDKGS